MTTRKAGEKAKAGFYFNLRTWEVVLHEAGEALPGEAGDRFVRFPTVTLLLLGPFMGLAFVIFLPVVGFALVGMELGRWVLAHLPARPAWKAKAARR